MNGGAQPTSAPEPDQSSGRGDELEQLIHEWEDLGKRYRELLQRYPGPIPELPPFVMVDDQPVFLSVGGRNQGEPLPPEQQVELREVQSRRVDRMAIREPLVPGWWPKSRAVGSKAQRDALEWRELLDNAVNTLRAHYEKYRTGDRLSAFPLCRFGKNSPIGEDQLLAAIDRHVELLKADSIAFAGHRSPRESPAATAPASTEADKKALNWREMKNIISGWRTNEWPQKLKEERERRGHSQTQAAQECGVKQNEARLTYAKWERGERPPSLKKYAPAVFRYIGYSTPSTEPST